MKRIFVDYTRLGRTVDAARLRTRLFGSERDGLVPGTVVIVEGDSVPDRVRRETTVATRRYGA